MIAPPNIGPEKTCEEYGAEKKLKDSIKKRKATFESNRQKRKQKRKPKY